MKNGTPFVCTNGQLATIASRILVSLPRAMEQTGLNIKDILRHSGEGERLSLAMAQAFLMLYNGDARVVPNVPNQKHGDLFNPLEYFVIRDGLWVSPGFVSRILSVYNEPTEKRSQKWGTHVDLPKDMYDSNIIKEYLGGEEDARKHAFTPDQIADLIDRQKNGENGEMLNNGYANIFYVIGKDKALFAVCVGWDRGNLGWGVDTCELDEDEAWRAGNRIFRTKN